MYSSSILNFTTSKQQSQIQACIHKTSKWSESYIACTCYYDVQNLIVASFNLEKEPNTHMYQQL